MTELGFNLDQLLTNYEALTGFFIFLNFSILGCKKEMIVKMRDDLCKGTSPVLDTK